MIATYALLTTAILILWCAGGNEAPALRRFFWLVPLIASVIAALAAGIVRPFGLVWIVAIGLATYLFSQPQRQRWQRGAAGVAIVILSAGLMTHRLPGFKNPEVIAGLKLSADAIPYGLHLNFDKTLIGLFVIGFLHRRMTTVAQWRTMARVAAPIAAGLIALIMVLSIAIGYVRLEPKFPDLAWLWMWVNLCFTCVAEEALFRGFIQAQLQRLWERVPRGKSLALGVSALLFGLAHAAGGPGYVALATIAGVGYGWVYLRTGRIEASILTHFALNAVHFFAFTYPALDRM